MNLQQYTIKHGTGALFALADGLKMSRGYFTNLLYAGNNTSGTLKTPSIKLAKRISDFTKGELSMEGLATPVRLDKVESRPRMKKGFSKVIDQ